MKTVACLIPLSWTAVPRQFFFSWSAILMHSFGKYHMLMVTSRAPSIRRMQEKMVESVLQQNVDYILFIDSDQTYPKDMPERMIEHIDSGKDMIFGLVPRHSDGGNLAFNFEENPLRLNQIDLKPDSGIVPVDCVGFGGLMVNPKIFSKIEKPYFSGLSFEYGPDVAFCHKCRKAGIQPWVDTSIQCGHIVPHIKYPHE